MHVGNIYCKWTVDLVCYWLPTPPFLIGFLLALPLRSKLVPTVRCLWLTQNKAWDILKRRLPFLWVKVGSGLWRPWLGKPSATVQDWPRGRYNTMHQWYLKSPLVPDCGGRYLTPAAVIPAGSVGWWPSPLLRFLRGQLQMKRDLGALLLL